MCELFGLSSNQPVQPGELLCRFGARGPRLGPISEMAVIATEPLIEGPGWLAFEPGELRVYRAGRQIAQFITHPRTKPIVSDVGRPAPLKGAPETLARVLRGLNPPVIGRVHGGKVLLDLRGLLEAQPLVEALKAATRP